MLLWICFLPAVLYGQQLPVPAEQGYAMNAPGVVMVQAVFSATVYVNKVVMNEHRFDALVDSVKKMDTSGNMFTPEEKLDVVVKALYNNPSRFFSRTSQYLGQQHRIVSSGTGFFVTGDGYLITNSHILDRDSEYIRRKFILSTYEEVTNANIKSLEASWEMTFTDEQRTLLNNAYSVIYSQVSSMILDDLKREIFVQARIDKDDQNLQTVRMPARLIRQGGPMPGKDVAIIKVDNVKQMPVLAMSMDSIARIGEQVWVYGYPEPVTSNLYLARENSTDPTLTAGIVSAIKQSVGKFPVIQMDAAITHGSSGSPVCNNAGTVIGLATFGSLEGSSGKLAAAYNFALPISVMREFLDSAGVVPAISLATTTYNKALEFYYDGYYGQALQKFNTVHGLNADYPHLRYYMDECDRNIKAGLDKESFLQQTVFRIMAIVIIVGGIFIFYRMKKSQRKVREN